MAKCTGSNAFCASMTTTKRHLAKAYARRRALHGDDISISFFRYDDGTKVLRMCQYCILLSCVSKSAITNAFLQNLAPWLSAVHAAWVK